MLNMIKTLFAPKVRATLVIPGVFSHQAVLLIQNHVRGWGMPGRMRYFPGSHIEILLEGAQARIQARLKDLRSNPMMSGSGGVLELDWTEATGEFEGFRKV